MSPNQKQTCTLKTQLFPSSSFPFIHHFSSGRTRLREFTTKKNHPYEKAIWAGQTTAPSQVKESVLLRTPKPSWTHPSSEQRAPGAAGLEPAQGTGTGGECPHQNTGGPQKPGVTSRPVPQESQDRTIAFTSGQATAHRAGGGKPHLPQHRNHQLILHPSTNPHV